MIGVGQARGTFGELLQGVLPDGEHFLVTLPVTQGTTAFFTPTPESPAVTVEPGHKHKALTLARLALDVLGLPGGGHLLLTGNLPEGKGMASSSADLVATARAVADAAGRVLTAPEIEALLRGLEPTDGVMYDHIVAFHHRDVRLRNTLGCLPGLVIVGYDEGGQVDTVAYNRDLPVIGPATRREYALLLDRLTTAVARGDLATVGGIATRSAELHAGRHGRDAFRPVRRACRAAGGLGVVAAHSGTMLGVLLAADDPELAAKIDDIRGRCASLGGRTSVHRSVTLTDAGVSGAS
ncbi:hypothetical protein [Streptosporangium sp. NPDC023615]|uniref:GHMP family kinase ATP-binding protein n=1 Tax=Streptosporangium sp. NPDC023615 TaxID=3154794 RepID=UPI00342A9C6D